MLDIKRIFGNNIKELRLSKNLSQEKFAEKVGTDAKTISRIENGNSLTSSETIANICSAFKVTPDELFKINYNFLPVDLHDKEGMIDNFILQLKNCDTETVAFLMKVNQSILENYDRARI